MSAGATAAWAGALAEAAFAVFVPELFFAGVAALASSSARTAATGTRSIVRTPAAILAFIVFLPWDWRPILHAGTARHQPAALLSAKPVVIYDPREQPLQRGMGGPPAGLRPAPNASGTMPPWLRRPRASSHGLCHLRRA